MRNKPQLELIWNDANSESLVPSFRRQLTEAGPMQRFVGNKEAIERLSRMAFVALERPDHCCADQAFAFLGPSSVGKTTLAKLFAETIGLPFAEVSCPTLSNIHDLMFAIAKICEGTTINGMLRTKALNLLNGLIADVKISLTHAEPSGFVAKLIELWQLRRQLHANTRRFLGMLPPEFAAKARSGSLVNSDAKALNPAPGVSYMNEFQDCRYCANLLETILRVPEIIEFRAAWADRANRGAWLQSMLMVCERAVTQIQALEFSEQLSLELVPDNEMATDKNFTLPPMIIFLDEAHALDKGVQQSLLRAIEPNDAVLTLYKGDAIWNIDTRNVCWMLATTDRGLLFDAFDTRFTKLNLELYTLAEIAQIVQIEYPEWSLDVCQLAAKYGGRIPRDALSLAREMALEQQYSPDKAWTEIAKIVARRNKIDEFGVSSTRLAVLQALGREEAISRPNLSNVVGCKVEEMDRYIMPSLMAATGDCVPLVKVTSRGYALTEAGYAELDKRNIAYRRVG